MANSPGGVEEGRVSLRVVPDTSRFAADLRAEMQKLRREIRLQIPVELDTTGLAAHAKAAVKEAEAAAGNVHVNLEVDRRNLSGISRTLTRFMSSLGQGLSGILRGASFAGLGLSAAGAVPNLLALAGSLAQVVGVIGLIPAGIAGAIIAIGTLAIGFHGFGQALKDLGDTKKFAADLKALSPAAADAAKAIKSFVPQLSALRKLVQEHLFAGLSSDIRLVLRSVLPPLRVGLAQVADSLNLVLHNSAVAISELAKSGQLAPLFRNIADALTLIAPAIADFLRSFVALASIGSSFLPALAGGLQNAATKFRNFTSSAAGVASIKDFIQTGIDAFALLFDIVKSTTIIIGGFVRAAQAAGGSTLTSFAATLQTIADVVNTPGFQSALTQVFAGILEGTTALRGTLPDVGRALAALVPLAATFAASVGHVLAAAIVAIVPVIQALAPPLNELLQALAPQLVKGIQALAPALANVANFLAANKPLLAAVAIGIAALAFPVLTAVAALLFLVANFATVRDFFNNTILPVFNQVVTFLQPMITAFQELGVAIIGLGVTVLPILQAIFAVVQANFPAIQQIIVQVFSTIQTIIVAVLDSLRIQIEAWTGVISVLWGTFGGAITSTISHVFPAILTIIHGVLNIIEGLFRAFSDIIHGNWSGLWNDVKQIVSGVLRVIQGIIQAAFFAIVGVVHIGIIQIVNIFKTLGSLLKSAVEALGPLMLHLGEGLILGMIKGITGMAGGLASSLKNTVTGAIGSLGKHLGINSPSLLFSKEIGEPIAEGIAHGITKASGQVDVALKSAVSPADMEAISTSTMSTQGLSRPGLVVQQVTVKDVDEMARVLAEKQRDAAVVENLQSQLVGA